MSVSALLIWRMASSDRGLCSLSGICSVVHRRACTGKFAS